MNGPGPESARALVARGIVKRFPGVTALAGVDLTVRPGEVVAVIGENGAGKSTLMKVLAGIHAPDAGTLSIDGRPRSFAGVRDAIGAGIALIHQELNLAENLDVAANLFLGREPHRFGWVDRARIDRESRDHTAAASARETFTPDTQAILEEYESLTDAYFRQLTNPRPDDP